MPYRAAKAAAATSETLKHIWISDELLSDSFNRFLRVSLAHRRYGSSVPGPLEARRRLAKRRLGVAASVGGNPPPGHDFGGLFGLGAASPPPEFEKGWRWQAPTPTRSPPGTTKTDVWQLPLFDGSIEQSDLQEDERVAQFLEVQEHPVETSKNAFEDLLSARQDKISLDQRDIEPILAFLQSSDNEVEAQLTLRIVQWLGERPMSSEAREALKDVMVQKITLRTISDEEESSLLMSLLKREDASTIVSSLIDQIPRSQRHNVLERTTNAILRTSDDRQSLLENWLGCFSASALFKLSKEQNNDHWDAIYAPLSQSFRPSDFPTHFSAMGNEAFARTLWQHWVPNLITQHVASENAVEREEEETLEPKSDVSSSGVPADWNALTMEFGNLRAAKTAYLSPNNDLVDLISVLANNRLPYFGLLEEVFAFWRRTQSIEGLADLVKQLRNNQPIIDLPTPLVSSLVQSFIDSGELGVAYHVFKLVPNVPLKQCHELSIKLIEHGRINSNKIWKIIDRWAEVEVWLDGKKQERSETYTRELTDLVHKAAYAWAKSPHLRARVAYRRVWECYRFLLDGQLPLSRLISRALVRAGVVNFVRERRPIPKTRIQYTLDLVGKIEGEDVKQQVDRMIFEYWMAHRRLARYKPAGQQAREKFLGEQVLDDGSVRSVKWDSRVLRRAVQIRRLKEEAVDGSENARSPRTHDGLVQEAMEGESVHATALDDSKSRDDVDSLTGSQELAEKAFEQHDASGLNEIDPATSESPGALDSAAEAREIAKMAFDFQYLPDPETSDWTFVAQPGTETNLVDAVPYRPHGADEISPHVELPPRGTSASSSAVREEVPETGISTGVALESDSGSFKAAAMNATRASSSSTAEQNIVDQAVQATSSLVHDSDSTKQHATSDNLTAGVSRSGGEGLNGACEEDVPSAFNTVYQPFRGSSDDGTLRSRSTNVRRLPLAKEASIRKEYSAEQPVTQADRNTRVNMNKSEKETESMSAEIKALRVKLAKLAKQNYELRQTTRANLRDEPKNDSQRHVARLEEYVVVSPATPTSPKETSGLNESESEDRAALVSTALLLSGNDTEVSASVSPEVEPLSSLKSSLMSSLPSVPPDQSTNTQTPQGSLKGSNVNRTPRNRRERHSWRSSGEDQLISKSLNPSVIRPDCKSSGILRLSKKNQERKQPVRRHNQNPPSDNSLERKRIRPAWQRFEQQWAENREFTGYESWYESWTKTHT